MYHRQGDMLPSRSALVQALGLSVFRVNRHPPFIALKRILLLSGGCCKYDQSQTSFDVADAV
jgi:hypothetical protein